MRRLILGPLAVCLLGACLAVSPARAADSPYEGTWKVTTLLGTNEIALWLVKFDKEGKTVEVVSGLLLKEPRMNIDVRKTKASELKSSDKAIRCQLTLQNGATFGLVAYPGKKKGALTGSLRNNRKEFIRIRLEKTEDTEIEAGKAVKNMAGSADFMAAVKTKDSEEKIKELQNVLKDHEGKPITFLTSQVLIGELIGKKMAADEFKSPAETYVKQAEPFGHEVTVGANLDVALMLTSYAKTQALGLAYAKKAADMLTDDDPKGLAMSVYLAQVLALDKNKKTDDIEAVVEKLEKVAEATLETGKDDSAKFGLTQLVANLLLSSPNASVQDVGLKYARSMEKQLTDKDAPSKKMIALQMLRGALEKRGKADEAKKIVARIDALEDDLDKEFAKTNLEDANGKTIVTKFDGRKGKSERIVLVELFTGAQCPPCVAADIAFDAAMKTYKSSEVVFLQYHLHIPGPDALTNADSVARGNLYDVESTPKAFINGKASESPLGGGKAVAKERYESLREILDEEVEKKAGGKIKLAVTRTGDKIAVKADVSDLEKTGEKVKLRFVLVEDVVRYVGFNRQRLHHQVVRALPGGAEGVAMEKKSGSYDATVNVAEVRKGLEKYLTNYAAKEAPFPTPGRPLDLKKLKIIAFVQNDDTKDVYQAAQIDIPEAKKEDKKHKVPHK
jgi:hypothetical protein